MTRLRHQMYEAMKLAGLASKTQKAYIHSVKRLAKYYNRSPEQITEREVQAFFLNLLEIPVAKGTFKTLRFGIQFLYEIVLDSNWPLFTKKKSVSPDKSACLKCFPIMTSIDYSIR
jgi:hypothetical protein